MVYDNKCPGDGTDAQERGLASDIGELVQGEQGGA